MQGEKMTEQDEREAWQEISDAIDAARLQEKLQ